MDKTSIAEELLDSGRLREELVTEQNFPVLKLLNWEFIEEDDYGHGRVEIIGEKSEEELRESIIYYLGYDSIEDMRKDLKILTTGYDDSGRLFDLSQQIAEELGQQRLFDEE